MKSGDYRITIYNIRGGQPRPYADTEHVVRVQFEWVPYTGDVSWSPQFITHERVIEYLQGLHCGFIPSSGKKEWWESYLDYLAPIDESDGKAYAEKHQLLPPLASIWEFRTVTPYTD